MKIRAGLLSLISALFFFGCSSDSEQELSNYINGRITVNEELETGGNYSGIELLVAYQDTAGERRDTIFHAVTDRDGYFSGTAVFNSTDLYPVVVSRNRNAFGIISMVFADGDTINFTGQLPDLNQTAEISSRENDVYQTFERVERNFRRVVQYINAGAISADSVGMELEKWSDIYWDLYEEYPGAYASGLAGEASISLLRGLNDSLMVARTEEILTNKNTLLPATRQALMEYYAEEEGLEKVTAFLDRLENMAVTEGDMMNLKIERIELLYDSSRTSEAGEYLDRFKNEFSDHERAMEWAENITYDLAVLSPGSAFPSFSFTTITGDSVSTETMEGTPFLIEITRLDNSLYQQQYDRTIAIYQIYRNFGLEIITIPLVSNDVVIQAFFENRGLYWPVAHPDSFDGDELIERLNINRVPTRFLIDDDGNIIRRYVGNEYDEVVQGLQRIITQ
ncbi:MAG: TlpA disulfide reductase family protein [Balneolaceae bacterium]